MGASSKDRVIMATDMLYLLTFTAGMAAFWASGHASAVLPAMKNHSLAGASTLVVTAGVYGLGMLLVTLLVTRHLGRAAVVSVIIAVALGLVAAQGILHLAAGRIHNSTDVALLTFGLYLVYGGIYVLSLAVARKFANIQR